MNNLPWATRLFSGIYMIKNILDGKVYIGSTKKFTDRFHQHRGKLRGNKHFCIHLQRAWNRDGEKNFVFEILEVCPIEKLIEREQFYMDSIKDKYNMSLIAGEPPKERSLKTRKKIGEAHKKRNKELNIINPFAGRSWSEPELKESLDVMKNKLSERMSGDKNPFYKKSHSEKTKQFLSKRLKGRKCPWISKGQIGNVRGAKKYKLTHSDGRIEIIFNLKEFCKNNLKFSKWGIYKAMKENKPYKGITFQKID